MTLFWDTYCKTMAQSKVYFRMPDGMEVVMPEAVKPISLSMAMIESGRGSTGLSKAYNLHAMKKRDDILVKFPIGTFPYDGGDGLYNYCACRTLREEIITWWAFMHRSPYVGVNWNEPDKRKLIDSFGKSYCPPGYDGSPAHTKWSLTTGFATYTDYVLALFYEATRELRKYGWEGSDDVPPVVISPVVTPVESPVESPVVIVPKEYYIDKGVICGPNVKYFWVKNFTKGRTKKIEGIIYHEPDAKGTGKELIGQGVINDWSNKLAWKSAHALFLEDGTILQTVNLNDTAWHCGFNNGYYNPRTIGFEFAYLGPFWPSREILGWFYRWKGLLWEQSIRKSDCTLINGMYWPTAGFTPAQIQSGKIITALLRKEYGSLYGHGHSEVDPENRKDPGLYFPIEEMRRLLA